MQHDYVLKKLKFDLLSPSPGSCGEVGVHGQINYFHVAASVIACNLINSITMFWISCI